MQQDRKYWAKNDAMLLGDTSVNQNPVIDAFKATHVPLPRPKEVSEKAMTVNYLPASKMPKHRYPRPTKPRWTEIEIKYGNKTKSKGRFNDVHQAASLKNDFDPLYTSFAPDNKFVPPTSSKDVIMKKNLKKQQMMASKMMQGQNQTVRKPAKEGSILKGDRTELSPGGKNNTSRNEAG